MSKKGFVFTVDAIACLGAVILLLGAYAFFGQSSQPGLTAKDSVDSSSFDKSIVGFYLNKAPWHADPGAQVFSGTKYGRCQSKINYPLDTVTTPSTVTFTNYCEGMG